MLICSRIFFVGPHDFSDLIYRSRLFILFHYDGRKLFSDVKFLVQIYTLQRLLLMLLFAYCISALVQNVSLSPSTFAWIILFLGQARHLNLKVALNRVQYVVAML